MIADVLLTVYICILYVLCAWTSRGLRRTFLRERGGLSLKSGCLLLLSLMPSLALCLVNLPLPLFYLLLYIFSGLPQLFFGRKHKQKLLSVNLRFLGLTAPHLIVIGAMALFAGTDVYGVLLDDTLRILSLSIAVTLLAAAYPLLTRFLGGERFAFIGQDSEEMRLFSNFVWFCICSVALDSIPCLFRLPTIFSVFFLIGSNVILMVMAVLFAVHVYGIMRDTHLKEESLRLQEETILQRTLTDRLEREAYLDILTGAYTRAYALSAMTDMLRSGEEFILAFLDLDGLKQINDGRGHLAGDQYLQKFSAFVRERLRFNDVFARYGGDEFLIMFPDCSLTTARERLAEIQREAGCELPFSFGTVRAVGGSAEECVSAADREMYRDKKGRRKTGEDD